MKWTIRDPIIGLVIAAGGLALGRLDGVILGLGLLPFGLPVPRHRALLLSALVLTVGVVLVSLVVILRDGSIEEALPGIAFLSIFPVVGFISYMTERRRLHSQEAETGEG